MSNHTLPIKRVLLSIILLLTTFLFSFAASSEYSPLKPDEIPMIYYILAIVGMICCFSSSSIQSTLWSFIDDFSGAILLTIAALGMGYPFWGCVAVSGLFMLLGGEVWKKVRGESILVNIKWLNIIVALILLIGGSYMFLKYD